MPNVSKHCVVAGKLWRLFYTLVLSTSACMVALVAQHFDPTIYSVRHVTPKATNTAYCSSVCVRHAGFCKLTPLIFHPFF